MSSENTYQRTGSTHSGRSASKVSSLLGRAQNSEHLQPLSDSTVLAEEKFPEQNHTMVKDYLDVDCDYNDLCKFLFQRAENLQNCSAHEKELFRKIQLEKQGDWFLSATKIAPWPPIRLKNHVTRLLAITLDFVNMVFKKSRMSNSAMTALFTANITEAHQAMASASEYSAQVCHKLLLDHPYTLTPECKLDIVAYNKDKFPNLVARIADGEGQDKDTAISQLADQNKIVTAALAQIQLVVNHQIIRMIGKLLTPAKRNGLILPKLKLAFTTHYAQQALKPKEERVPYSAKTAIKLLEEECTGSTAAQQQKAKRNLLLHTRTPKMQILDWFLSFRVLFTALRITGAQTPENDSDEHRDLFHEVFAPQLSQHEINLLFSRGYEDMCDSNFVFEELNKELAICHEIFGKFTIDSRVRLFLNTRAESYEIPAPAFLSNSSKRTKDRQKPAKRQRAFLSNEASQIKPRDYCTNPICVSANTHKNHTVAVCTRNSANPYRSNFRPRGKGKGKDKGKIKGKGRGGARNFSQARGLNPKGKGGKGKTPIPPVKKIDGQPYAGICFFCGKSGHNAANCKAKAKLQSQPMFITASTSFVGHHADSLHRMCDAVGNPSTCQHCYHPACPGISSNENCANIIPGARQAEALFINSGLHNLVETIKADSSSGLQNQHDQLQSSSVLLSNHTDSWGQQQHDQWHTAEWYPTYNAPQTWAWGHEPGYANNGHAHESYTNFDNPNWQDTAIWQQTDPEWRYGHTHPYAPVDSQMLVANGTHADFMLDTATESYNNVMGPSGHEANPQWPGAWIPPPQPQSSAWPDETSEGNLPEKASALNAGYDSENSSEESENDEDCVNSESEEI